MCYSCEMLANLPYSMPLKIESTDLDALGHVNNVVYLRWVQEVAASHWESLSKTLPPLDAVWVVLRHEIDYLKAAQPSDNLVAKTWVGATDGLRSVRHVHIETASGALLAKTQTTWCLVDGSTGQVRRMNKAVLDLLKGL